jgi:hypothetical protein
MSKLSANVVSRVFQPYIQLNQRIQRGEKNLDTLVVGKKMPFLDSFRDKTKLDKYIANFNNRLRHYQDNPGINPDNEEIA